MIIEEKNFDFKTGSNFHGWILTINRYGAVCLNARNMMFVDLDTNSDPILEKQAFQRIRYMEEKDKDFSGRIYKTHSGIRMICLSLSWEASQSKTLHYLSCLGSDRLFILMCKKQNCFRARLTPKPWRTNAPIPVFDSLSDVTTYLENAKYKVADFVGNFGNRNYLQRQDFITALKIHDDFCLVEKDLPLA